MTNMEDKQRWSLVTAADPEDALQSFATYKDTPLDFVREKLGFHPDRFQASIFDPTIKRGLLCCSRQFGKSTSVAALAVHHAVTQPQARVLIVAPFREQAAEFMEKVRQFLDALDVKAGPDRAHRNSIRLANGSRILLITAKPRSVRSYEATLLIIDEAAQVHDAVINAIRPAMAIKDGTMWMMSTPAGRLGAFYRAWSGPQPWFRLRVSAQECERFSPEFLAEERYLMGDREFAQEYEALFNSPEDAVFDEKLIDAALFSVTDPQPRILQQKNSYTIGLDLGTQRDYTAITVTESAEITLQQVDYIHWMRQTGVRNTVHRVERMRLGLPFTDIVSRLKSVTVDYPGAPILMDATGLGGPVYDMMKNAGISNPIRPVVITSADQPSGDHIPKKDLIMNLAIMLEQHDLRIPRELGNLPHLLEEMHAFRAIPTHTGYTRYEAAPGSHDDIVIALALSCWPRRPNQPRFGEQSRRIL